MFLSTLGKNEGLITLRGPENLALGHKSIFNNVNQVTA